MIVSEFLRWSRSAPHQALLDATDALVRSYLYCDADDNRRRELLTCMFGLVDHPSPQVRERMALSLADRRDAPRALVISLVQDAPCVCAPLCARSPLLSDSDLREVLARDDDRLTMAVAERLSLSSDVADRLLQTADLDVCQVLIANAAVELSIEQIDVFVNRFGDIPGVMDDLVAKRPVSARQACLALAKSGSALAENDFVRALVPVDRLDRVVEGSRHQAMLDVLYDQSPEECIEAISLLVSKRVVTPAFILRAAFCGRLNALEALVVVLTRTPLHRVRAAFVHRRPAVAAALLKRSQLPTPVLDMVAMALVLARELAAAEVDWDDRFFAETLFEVVEVQVNEDASDAAVEPTIALAFRIASDVMRKGAQEDLQTALLAA